MTDKNTASINKIESAITFTINSLGIFCSIPDLSKTVVSHGIRMSPEGGLPTAIEGSVSWHDGMPELVIGIPDIDGGFLEYVEIYAGDGTKPIDYTALRTTVAQAVFNNERLRKAVLGAGA